MPKVFDLKVTEVRVAEDDPEIRAACELLYPGRKNLFPLVQQELEFVLKDASSYLANALQRVMTQELQGYALFFDPGDVNPQQIDVHDKLMTPEFLKYQLGVPLRLGTGPADLDVTFELNVQNPGEDVLTVYAGDMKIFKAGEPYRPPLPYFNPTHEVGFVQPGRCLVVRNIRIVSSVARLFSAAALAVRGRQVPLDAPRLPREATHQGFQGDAERSGYVESPFVARPTEFRVGVTVPAALKGSQNARGLPAQACSLLLQQLRVVQRTIEAGGYGETAAAVEGSDSHYWLVVSGGKDTEGESGIPLLEGTLFLWNETDTLASLLKNELIQLVPDLAYAGFSQRPDANAVEFRANFRGAPEDFDRVMLQVVSNLGAVFTSLRGQFENA